LRAWVSASAKEPVLALFKEGKRIRKAKPGDQVEVVLSRTCFYVESGGQVSDTGEIYGVKSNRDEPEWEVRVDHVRRPAAGIVVHVGEVVGGHPAEGDDALAQEIGRAHV